MRLSSIIFIVLLMRRPMLQPGVVLTNQWSCVYVFITKNKIKIRIKKKKKKEKDWEIFQAEVTVKANHWDNLNMIYSEFTN